MGSSVTDEPFDCEDGAANSDLGLAACLLGLSLVYTLSGHVGYVPLCIE